MFFVAVGSGAFLIALNYPMGKASMMGPGYFPRMLSGLLILLGLPTALHGLKVDGPKVGAWPWKPMIVVLGVVALFGVLIPKIGLALTSFLLVVVSGLLAEDVKVKSLLIFAAGITAFAVIVFVYLLNLELPVWPWSV